VKWLARGRWAALLAVLPAGFGPVEDFDPAAQDLNILCSFYLICVYAFSLIIFSDN
jgi:hypothetical protein